MDETKPFKMQRLNIGSRVTREGHARFWERPEVKFRRATRQTETCLTTEPWSAVEWVADTTQPARTYFFWGLCAAAAPR